MFFSTGVLNTFKAVLRPYINDSIICYGSAADVLGLTTMDGFPLEFYTTSDVINSTIVKSIKVEELDITDTILIDGMRVTNEARTVCELLKMQGTDRFTLCECIFNLNNKLGEEEIFRVAEQYGVADKLTEYWEDAMEIYSE